MNGRTTETETPATLLHGRRVFRVEEESLDFTTAWDVRPTLIRALYQQGPELWVDLSAVRFIDSTGLGMLVGVLKEVRERNGALYLINPSPEVYRLFRVTGLEALFELPSATGWRR